MVIPNEPQRAYIEFGSGSLSGYFIEDVCSLGDDSAVMQDYQFGLVTKQTVFSGRFDAIIGLAYPSMAEPGLTPFFDAMMKQGLVEENMFAFYMSMNPLVDDSELVFGGYDNDRIEGKLSWHPVIDKLFWSLNLEDVRIGNRSLGIC